MKLLIKFGRNKREIETSVSELYYAYWKGGKARYADTVMVDITEVDDDVIDIAYRVHGITIREFNEILGFYRGLHLTDNGYCIDTNKEGMEKYNGLKVRIVRPVPEKPGEMYSYLCEVEEEQGEYSGEQIEVRESDLTVNGERFKIYIAGSISDNPNYENQFKEAEKRLRDNGHTVINPVENLGFSYKDYIDIGLSKLMKCNTLYLLDGWIHSRGASLEVSYADTVGYKLIEQSI